MNINWDSNVLQPQCLIVIASLPEKIADIPTARLSQDILAKLTEFNEIRQIQYLASRALLAELLFQLFNIETLPEIVAFNNGRPQFVRFDLPDFNISHSGDHVMIALARHCRIGADLEIKRERKRLLDLARYSFSQPEVDWLERCDEAEQIAGFWQLWTIRESILKLEAKGVWQMKALALDPLTQQIYSEFSQQLSCLTYQNSLIAWSISSDCPLTPANISLLHVDNDFTTFTPQVLPELTLFQTQ